MPRYWVIAPYHADEPKAWESVWKFDLENGIISIGWSQLGDISSLSEEQLLDHVAKTYDCSPAEAKASCRMVHKFYHSVQPGDIVIARRGRKEIAAIGTVKRAGYYDPKKNLATIREENPYPNHLDVEWAESPRNKRFDAIVFAMQTIYEIPQEKYRELVETSGPAVVQTVPVQEEDVQDQAEFVLEKHLEDFIVSNFDTIFKKKLVLYCDPAGNPVGQQFETDVGLIDILAQDTTSNAFVVFELKKGRPADKVVGQILRYMGWVAEKLCKPGQEVYGIIVCKEPDEKLNFALKMVRNVSVKYFKVDFKLQDLP
jgi:restriction system protein